jgi:4-hydroxy-tetrahydrodipicolinate synthase
MDASFIKGIIPAMITPMTEGEELDEKGFETITNGLIEAGVHGIFSVGTAGEFWALSVEEKKRVYQWTADVVDKRVPTYAGTSANSTREAIQLSELAQAAGIDCLSVLTPSYITPTQDQMFAHYAAVARSVDIPILLYNLPARTGNALAMDTVMRLAENFENIVGIKDSSGDFSSAMAYLSRVPKGFRFIMGNDALIMPAIMQGAAGAIAATANVAPELAVGIYNSVIDGDLEAAKDFQKRLTPVRKAFTLGTHPAMLKAGAEMVGYAGGPPRAPVSGLSDAEREALGKMLLEIGKTPK